MAGSDFKKILRRFTVTFTPLHGTPALPKTYNKYLVGIVISLRPAIVGVPAVVPIMIFAALSRCRICLQITTREMVTPSILLSDLSSLFLPPGRVPLRLCRRRLSPRFPSRPRSFRVSPIQSGLHYFVVRPRPHRIILTSKSGQLDVYQRLSTGASRFLLQYASSLIDRSFDNHRGFLLQRFSNRNDFLCIFQSHVLGKLGTVTARTYLPWIRGDLSAISDAAQVAQVTKRRAWKDAGW